MSRPRNRSTQTLRVLGALLDEAGRWWHGYDLARRTDLRSGTLYPILRRLAEQGLLEARWEEGQPEGRPRRHLYRLTTAGRSAAEAAGAAPKTALAHTWRLA